MSAMHACGSPTHQRPFFADGGNHAWSMHGLHVNVSKKV